MSKSKHAVSPDPLMKIDCLLGEVAGDVVLFGRFVLSRKCGAL